MGVQSARIHAREGISVAVLVGVDASVEAGGVSGEPACGLGVVVAVVTVDQVGIGVGDVAVLTLVAEDEIVEVDWRARGAGLARVAPNRFAVGVRRRGTSSTPYRPTRAIVLRLGSSRLLDGFVRPTIRKFPAIGLSLNGFERQAVL